MSGQVDEFKVPSKIKVRLTRELRNASSVTFSDAVFVTNLPTDSDEDTPVSSSAPKQIVIEAKGSKIQVSVGDADPIVQKAIYLGPAGENPVGITFGKRTRHYRGRIAIASDGDKLVITNIVDFETYLKGVVGAEIGSTAPVEALKSQAICSRTFAIKVRSRYKAKGYDLDDTTMSQFYGGVEAEKPASDEAVIATKGLVLEYNGSLIWADFYDDCGGVTSPGNSTGDYPPPVLDGPNDTIDFCQNGSKHTWNFILTSKDITKKLSSADSAKVGNVMSVDVLDRDSSGRVSLIAINGEDGSLEMPGAAFRSLIGVDKLPSTLFKVVAQDKDFKFDGKGYGHGHGLCQAGAIGMASAPYMYSLSQILNHYFPNSKIRAIDVFPGKSPER